MLPLQVIVPVLLVSYIILVALDKKSTPEETYRCKISSTAGQNTSLYFFFYAMIITV